MPNVIISADSTCDLSPEQREHYQVRSFPFHIEFRGRDHLDNIDITPQVLFDGFYEDKSLPQTGACSPEAYRQHFAELTADGSKVVHFNLGSALSSAYENASAAAADMEGVYVIDGKSLSTGIGLQVLAACRMRDAGMSAADIAHEASELHNRSHASFVHHGVPCRRRPLPHAGGLPGRQTQLSAGHPGGQPERRHEGGQALPRQAGKGA